MIHAGQPLVSVIIPAYNKGPYIGAALESLFRQTYPGERTEIIVVDDGSSDETQDVLRGYGGRIVHVRQENRGIASARNRGFGIAGGEIITFLDADDVWHEERLRKVVERFEREPRAGIVYHAIELIDGRGDMVHRNFLKVFGYLEGADGRVANEIFSGRIFCGGSSFAFRRAVLDSVYPVPEDIKRGVDYYTASLSSCLAEAGFIADVLGRYRVHGNNTTMMAGRNDHRELAAVNREFAFMRQMVIDMISGRGTHGPFADIDIIRRIQAKEMIFCDILSGRRAAGIKKMPFLFKGRRIGGDIPRGIAVSIMALLVPASLYTKMLSAHEILKRWRIARF